MTKRLITHLSDNHIAVQASVKALRVSLDAHLEGRKSCFVKETIINERRSQQHHPFIMTLQTVINV